MFPAFKAPGFGLGLALLIMPAVATAKCQVGKYAEIPVVMNGRAPTTTAQINGRDARFIVDSGAFYSTISAADAREFGLSVRGVGPNVRLKGVGGDTSLGVATAQTFT